MRELKHKRTLRSKTFDLGNGRHRIELAQIPIHFERDGELHDIDLTASFDKSRKQHAISNCPYSLRVSADEPAYAYNSRGGKRVSVELVTDARGATVEGGLFKWGDVGRDTDYIIQPLPAGCATLLVLNTPDAPRKWSWKIQGDMGLIVPLVGKDSAGRQLELIERRDAGAGLIEVEWTGRTISPRDLRRNAKAGWSDTVTWPVVIDPTVNENVAANADDANSFWNGGGATFSNFVNNGASWGAGRSGAIRSYGGVRFQTLPIPTGVTVNSATLTLRTILITGSPNINIFGNNVDDAAAYATPGNRIKNITKTAASVNKASWTATADNAITVTTIVAEILARSGWASNNDIAFGLFNNSGSGSNFVTFAALEHATLTEARLSIDYTAGAVITTAAASTTGTATATAAGSSFGTIAAAASTTGAATATAAAASTAGGAASTAGAAGGIAIAASGGLALPIPDAPPSLGGGGGIGPPYDYRAPRIRKERTKPKVYTIKIGEWPEELSPEELARQEEMDVSSFIARIPQEEEFIPEDDDEEALMLIMALAA